MRAQALHLDEELRIEFHLAVYSGAAGGRRRLIGFLLLCLRWVLAN